MSAYARNLLAAALLLGAASIAVAAPAYGPRGLSVQLSNKSAWTLTVVNLTNEPLELVSNAVTASGNQRPPFHGNTLDDEAAFPLGPYQNVTWKSNTESVLYPHPIWIGALKVRPQQADPKWTATVNFSEFADHYTNSTAGTAVYLTADFAANPNWQDQTTGNNISCSYPADYSSLYNVMTLSGTNFIAVLYAPYIDLDASPTTNAVLVIRQRWPGEVIHAPCLRYTDNNGFW